MNQPLKSTSNINAVTVFFCISIVLLSAHGVFNYFQTKRAAEGEAVVGTCWRYETSLYTKIDGYDQRYYEIDGTFTVLRNYLSYDEQETIPQEELETRNWIEDWEKTSCIGIDWKQR